MTLTLLTWNLPPPDHLSGNQPVLMSHRRINSCSGKIIEHCVPRCFVSDMSFICIAIIVVYLLFLPHSYSIDLDTATTVDVDVYDYFVDDRTSTVELPGKQSHFPSADIAYLFRTFLALGI